MATVVLGNPISDDVMRADSALPATSAAQSRATAEPDSTGLLLAAIAVLSGLGHAVVLHSIGVNAWALAIVHAGMVVMSALVLHGAVRNGQDVSVPLLGVLAGAAIGPIGLAGAVVVGKLQSTSELELLDAWYDRISQATAVDPVARLSDDVSVGRSVNLTGAMPASFVATVEEGSLEERQAILGIIARRFHSDYIPVLRSALRSSDPVVRVQAAAVAARIRPDIGRQFQQCIEELSLATASGSGALALLQKIEAYVTSGLLDESDRKRGIAVQQRLSDIVLHELRGMRLHKTTLATTDSQMEALERVLLQRSAYGELRSVRSAAPLLAKGHQVRIRRIGSIVPGMDPETRR